MKGKYPERLTEKEERQLLGEYRNGDMQARERLIMSHARLVHHIAKRLTFSGMTTEDATQEGMMGLMHAIDLYDPELAPRLAPYAARWVSQYIFNAKIRRYSLVRIPAFIWEKRKGKWNGEKIPDYVSISASQNCGKDSPDDEIHDIQDTHDHVAEFHDKEQRAEETMALCEAISGLEPYEQSLIKGLFGVGRTRPAQQREQMREFRRGIPALKAMQEKAMVKLRKAMLA